MSHSKPLIDKAFYPWLVWSLTVLFFFYKYLLQFSTNVMATDLMGAFNLSGAGLGNLAACFYYTYMLMQLPVGILLDKYSPQKMVALAILLCAVGAYIFSHATSLWVASVSRAMIGLGASFAPVACLKFASVWFPPRRFALIAGLSMTFALTGAANAGYPLSKLVSWFGWRDTLTYLAIPGIILAFLFLLLVRPKPNLHTQQEEYSVLKGLKEVLTDKQTVLLSIYSGLAYAPFSMMVGLWGVPFLTTAHHLTPTNAAAKASLIIAGFAIGAPILGWISDYLGRRKIMIYFGTLLALTTISWIIYFPVGSEQLLNILMFGFGVGISGFLLCFSMVREVNRLVLAGTALGFMNMFDSLGEAISEPLIGKLLDLGWTGELAENGARLFSIHDYQVALSLLPIYFIVAFICLIFVKETHGTQKM